MRDDLAGAIILTGIFAIVLSAAEAWSRLGSPKPEWTRKFVHMGGGAACLLFPFLVESPWIVLIMAIALSGCFALGGRFDFLKSLHGVDRKSRGSEYYPLAISLTFFLTLGAPWIYVSAVLVLAVADAGAALIGSRIGRIRYEVEDTYKSLEGSVIFFVIAFFAILVPSVLFTDLVVIDCVLAALLVALLVTGFEVISLEGTDNLFIPLGVAVILPKITSKPTEEMIYQNISLFCLVLFLSFLIRKVRTFNIGGALALILFTYGTWSLGNEIWALPVLSGSFLYAAFVGAEHGTPICQGEVKVRDVFRAALIPLLLLVIGNMTFSGNSYYGPFISACVVVLGLTISTRIGAAERSPAFWFTIGLFSWGVVSIPAWWIQDIEWRLLWATAVIPIPLILAFNGVSRLGWFPQWKRRWLATQFLLTAMAAVVILLMQRLQVLPLWNPDRFDHPL